MSNFLLKIKVMVKIFAIFIIAFLFFTTTVSTARAVDILECGTALYTCVLNGAVIEGNTATYNQTDTTWDCIYGNLVSMGCNLSTPVCGNSIKENGEMCDNNDFGSLSCTDYGYAGGTLTCTSTCTIDQAFPNCISSGFCGNGTIETGEDCDAGNLNGQTCESLGAGSGTLACNNDCTFNTSGCVLCGNGIIETGEECDSDNLDGQDCVSRGYDYGKLSCVDSMCVYNTLYCYHNNPGEFCGDDIVNGNEQCEDISKETDCDADLICSSCMCVTEGEPSNNTNTSTIGCKDGADPESSEWSAWKEGKKPCPDCGTSHEQIFAEKPSDNLCKGTDFVGPIYVAEEKYPEYSNYYYTDKSNGGGKIYEPSHSDVLAKWTWDCRDSSGWVKHCEAYPKSECNADISAQKKCDTASSPTFDTQKDFKDKRDEKKEFDRYCKTGKYNVWAGYIQDCQSSNNSWNTTFNKAWRCVGYSNSKQLSPVDDDSVTANHADCSAKWLGKPKCGYLNKIEEKDLSNWPEELKGKNPDDYWRIEDTDDCSSETFFKIKSNTAYNEEYSNAFCDWDGGSRVDSGPTLTQTKGLDDLSGTAVWNWTCRGLNNESVACSTSINDTCLNGECGTDNGLVFPNKDTGKYPYHLCKNGKLVKKEPWPMKEGNALYYRWSCESTDGGDDAECSATLAGKCGPLSSYWRSTNISHVVMGTKVGEPAVVTSASLSELCDAGQLVNMDYDRYSGCSSRGTSSIKFIGGAARYGTCLGVWRWACGTADNYEECTVEEDYPMCGSASVSTAPPFSTAFALRAYDRNNGDCYYGNKPAYVSENNNEFNLSNNKWHWNCDIKGYRYTGNAIKFYKNNARSVNCEARYGE
jgi:hypothetical protein